MTLDTNNSSQRILERKNIIYTHYFRDLHNTNKIDYFLLSRLIKLSNFIINMTVNLLSVTNMVK